MNVLFLILGFLFISILGTLAHFIYDWSNHNKLAGVFFAVNESSWEHIKMALTPLFIWIIILGFFFGKDSNFLFSQLVSVLIIIIVIPLLFYGYKILTGKSILLIDILIFYIAIFLSQWFSYIILNSNYNFGIINYISLVLLIIIFTSYLLLTIFPIETFLFLDPITKKYGIKAHNHKITK